MIFVSLKMMDKEELFCAVLDAAQEYLRLQQDLGASMRSGFINLASARYSMGPDRVSTLQMPMTMTASRRISYQRDEFQVVTVGAIETPLSGHRDKDATEDAGEPADDNVEDSSDIIAQLGSKYGCDFQREVPIENGQLAEHPRSIDPIEWYGSLVSPNLRQSQENFSTVLEVIVKLANTRNSLLRGLHEFN